MSEYEQVQQVPDGVMASFLEAARLTLEAAWASADCLPAGEDSPKGAAFEAKYALDRAIESAGKGDGADAVIGGAMIAKGKAERALRLRVAGSRGEPYRPAPRGLWGY